MLKIKLFIKFFRNGLLNNFFEFFEIYILDGGKVIVIF